MSSVRTTVISLVLIPLVAYAGLNACVTTRQDRNARARHESRPASPIPPEPPTTPDRPPPQREEIPPLAADASDEEIAAHAVRIREADSNHRTAQAAYQAKKQTLEERHREWEALVDEEIARQKAESGRQPPSEAEHDTAVTVDVVLLVLALVGIAGALAGGLAFASQAADGPAPHDPAGSGVPSLFSW